MGLFEKEIAVNRRHFERKVQLHNNRKLQNIWMLQTFSRTKTFRYFQRNVDCKGRVKLGKLHNQIDIT